MKDLYQILNVNKESTSDDIKKSYKKLAFIHHPDKNKNNKESESNFQEISEAYQTLSNTEKRKNYDLYGDNFLKGGSTFVSPIDLFQSLFEVELNKHMSGFSEGNIFFFSDLSSLPFSMNKEKQTIYEIEISLKEFFYGIQKKIYVDQKLRDGTIKNTKYIINIKKGSLCGDNIIVKEGGDYNIKSEKYQDLIIKLVEGKSGNNIRRINDDLIIHKQISLSDSLCDLNTVIDIFDEKISINTGNIIKPNDVYYLDNNGMPIKDTEYRGKLIIIFDIIYPEYITDYQKDSLKEVLNHEENQDYNNSDAYEIYYHNDQSESLHNIIKENHREENYTGCAQQ